MEHYSAIKNFQSHVICRNMVPRTENENHYFVPNEWDLERQISNALSHTQILDFKWQKCKRKRVSRQEGEESLRCQHSPRMESWENSECLWEISQKTKQESFDLFKTRNCSLKCLFGLHPGVVERGDFTSAVIIHIHLWEDMFLSCEACSCDCILYSGDSS